MMGWDEYFHEFALSASAKSKDTTKVGAVLVGPQNEIRLTGYNGFPKGVKETPERTGRPAKYQYTNHAEANLISFAARFGIPTEGCSIYVTHFPCCACTRQIIQAGISCVNVGDGVLNGNSTYIEEMLASEEMLLEAGIRINKK